LDLSVLSAHFSNGSYQAYLEKTKILSYLEFTRKVEGNKGKKAVDSANIFLGQVSLYWIFEIVFDFLQ